MTRPSNVIIIMMAVLLLLAVALAFIPRQTTAPADDTYVIPQTEVVE